MRPFFRPFIYATFVGVAMSNPSFAQEMTSVEWAPFIKAAGVDDQALIEAADEVNSEFLSMQPGFISRELVRKSETEYADIIHWRTTADAESASEKVLNCAPCGEYFALMDMEASATSGAGFSYYEVLKSW
ncbi:hypothetical protein MNBD_ALPHA07-921 [hydrothermal vent metagenome]|uniref:Uncharacterized protein n=1 Tax=hydrothermal vent metagenome TaxID=652676 RepID=A0A3B0SLK7_9ZZZZ